MDIQPSKLKPWTSIVDTEFANCSHEDHDLAARAFRKIASKSKIYKFIEQCNLYDNERKQWKIPQDTSLHENVLYQPYIDICNQVIAHFGLSNKRLAINTHNKSMSHQEGIGPKYPLPNDAQDNGYGSQIPDLSTAPDICFQALVSDEKAADNFPYAVPGAEPTYRMTVTPFELKTASTFSAKGNLKQIAVYARYVNSSVLFFAQFCVYSYLHRQVFRQQGNRHLVNVLTGSPSEVRLYAFARDGVHYSSPINIHNDPNTFVRFILGASSDNAEFVGFDPPLYWENGERFIDLYDAKTKRTNTCLLLKTEPFFDHRAIRRRGTCCWLVEIDGMFYVLKAEYKEERLMVVSRGCRWT